MGFTAFWPLFLLITIPLLILLYILKRKYREEVFSSTLLWSEVYKNTRANTPWEKFRKNIMLLLQILAILALIFSLMKPFLNFGGKSYKNIILVIDNTASMNITYGNSTRLEEAKRLAKELINSIKEETNTFIISYDNSPKILQKEEINKDKIIKSIESIEKSYYQGDISDSINFIKAIGQSIEEDYEVILFTDKEISLGDLNGTVVALGNTGLNGSIDNISHKYLEDKIKVIATVTNRGSEAYEGDFSLYDGDKLIAVETLNLNVGENKTLTFDIPAIDNEVLKGELSRHDLLEEDNIYYHVLGNKKLNKILLVTEQNLFLERALSNIRNSEVYKTNSLSNLSSSDNYDLYVFDNVTPTTMPSSGSILFINPSSNEYFKVLEGGQGSEAKAVRGEVSNYLEAVTFTLAKYNEIDVPYYGRSFINVDEVSIGFKGTINNRNIAALSFDLHNSDFVLKKEFPILIYELGENLISNGMTGKSNYKYGEKIIVNNNNLNSEMTVITPNKETFEIKSGEEIKGKMQLGVYKIESEKEKELFSINYPSERESDTSKGSIGEMNNKIKEIELKKGFNLSPIFILMAIGIVALEWSMYKKGN
ncbi:vWA domain-containing protein [Caproiciproducens sp. MSJ-32]|uniref:vWA domain-containing protein n=1 Tax=Caproiciproducens sp. MSJ-32 TaxID=2841527 RepID=UPI001C11F177|nr:VWA domain-containing protein [Caproiciproducens sp. MSJ-32]MBU5454549.1 VWA domain-containing protein [Caproiciproducens sp. MSJ-32]